MTRMRTSAHRCVATASYSYSTHHIACVVLARAVDVGRMID